MQANGLFRRFAPLVYCVNQVSRCKPCERHCKIRIQFDRSFEHRPGNRVCLFGEAPPLFTPPQEIIVCFEVVRGLVGRELHVLRQLGRQRRYYLPCNLVLYSKDVRQFPIITLCPKMSSGSPVD